MVAEPAGVTVMRFVVLGKKGQGVMELNRRQAIRERCLNCVGWIPSEVRKCDFADCALHPYRMGTGKQDAVERAVAVRLYCLDCCLNQPTEVRLCPCRDCSLYPFRLSRIDKSVEIQKTDHVTESTLGEGTA